MGSQAKRTLNANMNIILRLLGLPCCLVGFGEGVWKGLMVSKALQRPKIGSFECDVAASEVPTVRVCRD